MTLRRRVAVACFGVAALLSFFFAALYLTSPRLMPYHLAAIGLPWSEIRPQEQVVMLAILRVAGGGFLTSAAAQAFLLAGPFRAGARWAPYALLTVGMTMAAPAAYAVWLVTSRTEGRPPWAAVLAGVVLLLVGFTAAVMPRRGSSRRGGARGADAAGPSAGART